MQFFSNYHKISELSTIDNEVGPNPFDGDGVPYKGKLIGMEDLSVDCDEKVCLDSMFRLKAGVRARGEHKQKIQLNLSLDGVKVIDESTKIQLASHEIRRISFVVMDPSDIRALGYIYNTNDDRHQFWAIKTDRPAHSAVFALKDLFEEAFKQMNKSETNNLQANPTISTPASLNDINVSIQQSSPEFTPQLLIQSPESVPPTTQVSIAPRFNNIWGDSPSTTVSQPLQTSQEQLKFDDNVWGDSSSTTGSQPLQTSQQQLKFDNDAWGFSEPAVSVKQPASRVESPRFNNLFTLPPPPLSRRSTTTQQSTPTTGTSDVFSLFTTAPSVSPVNNNVFIQPTQQTSFISEQQPNFLDSMPVSSITSSSATSSFGEFDLLGDFSSKSTVAKPTNELFFP